MLKVDVDSTDLEMLKERLQKVAVESFDLVRSRLGPEDQKRTGGYLRIFVTDSPKNGPKDYHELLAFAVGFVDPYSKWSTYKNLSFEKALRLMKNHALYGDETSWETIRASSWEFPGAILLFGVDVPLLGDDLTVIISFSGSTAMADEAVDLQIASTMQWGSVATHRSIAKMTGNSIFRSIISR